MNSQAKPVIYYLNVKSKISNYSLIKEYRIMHKKGDDLRKDFHVMQSLELMKKVS